MGSKGLHLHLVDEELLKDDWWHQYKLAQALSRNLKCPLREFNGINHESSPQEALRKISSIIQLQLYCYILLKDKVQKVQKINEDEAWKCWKLRYTSCHLKLRRKFHLCQSLRQCSLGTLIHKVEGYKKSYLKWFGQRKLHSLNSIGKRFLTCFCKRPFSVLILSLNSWFLCQIFCWLHASRQLLRGLLKEDHFSYRLDLRQNGKLLSHWFCLKSLPLYFRFLDQKSWVKWSISRWWKRELYLDLWLVQVRIKRKGIQITMLLGS